MSCSKIIIRFILGSGSRGWAVIQGPRAWGITYVCQLVTYIFQLKLVRVAQVKLEDFFYFRPKVAFKGLWVINYDAYYQFVPQTLWTRILKFKTQVILAIIDLALSFKLSSNSAVLKISSRLRQYRHGWNKNQIWHSRFRMQNRRFLIPVESEQNQSSYK